MKEHERTQAIITILFTLIILALVIFVCVSHLKPGETIIFTDDKDYKIDDPMTTLTNPTQLAVIFAIPVLSLILGIVFYREYKKEQSK